MSGFDPYFAQQMGDANLDILRIMNPGPPSSSSEGVSDSSSQSSTYFSDPEAAGYAGSSLAGLIGDMSGDYSQFVNDPTSSAAFQNSLSGLLAALHPGEQEGMRNLADMYRAAGNTASSSYGEAMNKYQQGVDRNRMSMASDLLAKLYPSIAGAMYAPISQTSSLMDAYKLNESTQESHSENTSSSGPSAPGHGVIGSGWGGGWGAGSPLF